MLRFFVHVIHHQVEDITADRPMLPFGCFANDYGFLFAAAYQQGGSMIVDLHAYPQGVEGGMWRLCAGCPSP
jgi:hypothetical protein